MGASKMWTHRKVILISLVLILSLVSICLRKRKQKDLQLLEKTFLDVDSSKLLESFIEKLWKDTEVNRTNLFYVFSLRRAHFWDCDFQEEKLKDIHAPEIIEKSGNEDQSERNSKTTENITNNNVNSANPVIISCILWLLLSLGKACFEMRNDLRERKKSSENPDPASRRCSLQQFTFARFDRKTAAGSKLCRRSTIESFQPATSFATNYELMRANEAQRILSLTPAAVAFSPPLLTRRCSVPAIQARQLPRQSSLGHQTPSFQRQLSGESITGVGVDRSPEGKRRMRMIYRH